MVPLPGLNQGDERTDAGQQSKEAQDACNDAGNGDDHCQQEADQSQPNQPSGHATHDPGNAGAALGGGQ